MKIKKSFLTGILCLAVPALLLSQDFSNKGKEFWISYSYHVGMLNLPNPTMTLYITSDVNTNYRVEAFGGATIQSGSIIGGQVVTVIIPNTYFINGEGKFSGRAIRVLTDKNSVVYSYITRLSVSGATVCLPTQVLGKEYYSVNYTQLSNETNSNSYFTIIAVEDNTTVEITPSSNTKNGWIAGKTYTVNLNQGEIYQVLGTTSGTSGSDLTGSLIKSVSTGPSGCKRIAVFSGSGKIYIGACSPGTFTSDNLYQQLYPTGSWGLKYLTVPSYNRPVNFYRIIRKSATTNVYLNGSLIPPAAFVNGVYYEFSNSIPNEISATEPVSVAQYFTTQGCSGNGAPYDPDMIILNPVEQNINNVTLVSSNLLAASPQHHLHVIMRNSGTGISSFKLDGVPVSPSLWVVHPGDPSFSYLYLANVTQGFHTLSSDSGFNALAYGYAQAESYGYSAGANVKDQYQFVSILNQYATVNFPATCKGSPFYFRIVFPYKPTQIKWEFGTALNAMGISDTTIISPVEDSTWSLNGRQLYRFSLPSSYSIGVTGTYPIRIIANNPTADGCSGIQEIDYDLQVFNPPVAGFNFTTNGCVTAPVDFTDVTNAGGRPIIKWLWNFGDGSFSSVQNPKYTYAMPGTYSASLNVITDVGCISDSIQKNITLTQAPSANFGMSTVRCSGKPVTFFDSSSITGAGTLVKWIWDFGDGTPAVVSSTNASQVHTYAASGTYNPSLKVESGTGCQSLVFSIPLVVHVNPVASFPLPANICMPSGQAVFSNNSTISDGTQSLLSYTWDFGDGASSMNSAPVHSYTGMGPYVVKLTATSNNGCTDDTVQTVANIYAQPQAAFSSPSEVCLGNALNFTDQSTAPGSTVSQWLWNFGDGRTTNVQNPANTYAAAGSYNVSLTITSAAGCTSTVAVKPVLVNPLPTANFGISSPACENRNIVFTDSSAANAGNLVKWTWDFGNGSNIVLSSPSSVNHKYTAYGTYNVTLLVESNKGCISPQLQKPVKINPLPQPGFISPAICLSDPYAPFTDTSKIAAGSIVAWSWNFGDPKASTLNPNTSLSQNPTHRYTLTGSYTATLVVLSDQGCVDSISQNFTVNGSIPLAGFTVQNATTLCSNREVVITNNSSVDFGQLVKTVIYWDFANDTTIQTVDNMPTTGKNYKHTYSEFGSPATKSYTIKMISYSGINCLNEITKTITVLATPSVRFNAIPEVCSNSPAFQLSQAGITNVLPGNGVYSGPGVSATGLFNPATAGDGIHTLRYTYTGTNSCTNFMEQTITVNPTPTANAGPDKTVLEGGSVQLTPALFSGFPVTYLWSPSTGLDSVTIPDPHASPTDDITYTLTVSSEKGCSSTDQVFVKVLKTPQIPNIFSPNGDGIHDRWEIAFLETYPGATVEIFNRYGQRIYYSVGYSKPWDGTVNGKPVPVGTYYYIVDPKNGRKKQAGYVDIIR